MSSKGKKKANTKPTEKIPNKDKKPTEKKKQDKTREGKNQKEDKDKKESKPQSPRQKKKSNQKSTKQTKSSEEITEDERNSAKAAFIKISEKHLQTIEPNDVLEFERKAMNGDFSESPNLQFLRLSDFLQVFTKIEVNFDISQINLFDLICLIYAHIISDQLSDNYQQKLHEIEQKIRVDRNWVPEKLSKEPNNMEKIYLYLYLSKIKDYDEYSRIDFNSLLEGIENGYFPQEKCITYLHLIIQENVPENLINEQLIYCCAEFLKVNQNLDIILKT